VERHSHVSTKRAEETGSLVHVRRTLCG
jgi:hypothetical protein